MKKKFDCVEMKRRIQAKQTKRFKGLTNREQIELMRREILQDPILARIWAESIKSTKQAADAEMK